MKVEYFSITRLQNLEHYRFAKNVLTLCRQANIAKLNLVLDPLEKAIAQEDLALNPPISDEMTPTIISFDSERIAAYQSIRWRIRSYTIDSDGKLREAAKKVEEIMHRYGNLNRMNYDKRTAAIENFLTDIKESSIQSLVRKLSVESALKRLEEANTAFADSFLKRLNSDYRRGNNIKAHRAETDRCLAAVTLRMQSIDDLEPSATITTLISLYNRLVSNRRVLLARRTAFGDAATQKRREEIEKLLAPKLAELVREEVASAIFAGRTIGKGKARHYLVTIIAANGDEREEWCRVEQDELVFVPEEQLPKPKKKKKPVHNVILPATPSASPPSAGGHDAGAEGSIGGGL